MTRPLTSLLVAAVLAMGSGSADVAVAQGAGAGASASAGQGQSQGAGGGHGNGGQGRGGQGNGGQGNGGGHGNGSQGGGPGQTGPDDANPDDTGPDEDAPADDTGVAEPDDQAIGLIEAPTSRATAVPEGAFALAPERVPSASAPRGRSGPMGSPPVVVELFTAQGCSTCPPADALIAALADQPDVLTLSWHVDYWDYLGWPDGFARPANTARQESYAAVAGERGVYTPQIIVDGQDTLIGVGRAGLLALIDDHAARPPAIMVSARTEGDAHVIDLTPRAAIPGGVEVTLVRYLPRRDVRVTGGENRGLSLGYRNIVVGAETLDRWPARTPLRLTVTAAGGAQGGYPADTRHAIIVQQVLRGGRPGPILAALRLD